MSVSTETPRSGNCAARGDIASAEMPLDICWELWCGRLSTEVPLSAACEVRCCTASVDPHLCAGGTHDDVRGCAGGTHDDARGRALSAATARASGGGGGDAGVGTARMLLRTVGDTALQVVILGLWAVSLCDTSTQRRAAFAPRGVPPRTVRLSTYRPVPPREGCPGIGANASRSGVVGGGPGGAAVDPGESAEGGIAIEAGCEGTAEGITAGLATGRQHRTGLKERLWRGGREHGAGLKDRIGLSTDGERRASARPAVEICIFGRSARAL